MQIRTQRCPLFAIAQGTRLLDRDRPRERFLFAPRPLLLRYALRVTLQASDRMNVVLALGRFERSIHGLDIEPAIGELRMAIRAGSASRLPMLIMASQTTESFMDSKRRPVIAGTSL